MGDFDTLLAGGIVFRDVGTPVLREFSPARRGILSLWREVSSPWRAMSLASWDDQFQSFCPSGAGDRLPARLGRLCGAQQGGAGYGAAPPFAAPLASPPEHPPKRGHQHPLCCEGTRLKLRELPSLAALAQAISLRAA